MDLVKIGKFLKELRCEKKLTQEQLGEFIGVTNKTISRWENGNYMPPVEMLQALSDFYAVSINEILSGERLTETSYKEKAEENIKTALNQSAFTLKEKINFFKRKWRKDHLFDFIVSAIIVAAIFITGFIMDNELLFSTSMITGLVLSIIHYNRMMAYVERNAF